MASVLPPPAKRQRREELARSKTQQDVTPRPKPTGVFHAQFVDPEGNQLGDNVAIPFSHAAEKDVSQTLNLLLERV
jgi:ribosome assembly protein 4